MKNKFNILQKKYCNLENKFEIAFVVKTGWIYDGIVQQETTLMILDNTEEFEDMYYIEGKSTYRDPGGDILSIIHESMCYFEPPLDDGEWYLEFDKELTNLYRGRLWFEVKKEIYEEDVNYNWFDKAEFLSNYDDVHYIIEQSKPLVHVVTSKLKMTSFDLLD